MVEMIQRIFRSFEHNNLGALYPPPEGTGFTARVITKGRSQRIKNRKLLRRRSFISKRIVRGLSGLRYLPRQVCRGSTHRELEVSTTQSASKKSCQPNRQAAFRFFLQSLHVNDGGKAFCVKGSSKRLEVVRGASRDGALK